MPDPAFQMRLQKEDGTALFTFTDGTNCVIDGERNGWNLAGNYDQEVEWIDESVNLVFKGNLATARANLRTVEHLLVMAQRWNRLNLGYKIFIAVKVGADTTWWRSELKEGSMSRFEIDLGVATGTLPVTLKYTRRNYWEGDEAALPLSNLNGTNVTNGINIYPRGDGAGTSPNKYCNYVEVSGSDIAGNLPTPPVIQLINTYNSGSRINDVRLAVNHQETSTPDGFSPLVEGENYAVANISVSKTNDSGASGGQYAAFSPNNSTMGIYACWTLSDMTPFRSRWFKVIAYAWIGNMTRLQARITYWPGFPVTNVAYGPLINLSGASSGWKFYDFGSIQIPPWLAGRADVAPVDLTLYGISNGSGTLNIDYFMLLPVDEYRYLTPRGIGLGYGYSLLDDGINRQVAALYGTTAGYYVGFGKQVKLIPGKTCRIYFAYETNAWPAQVILIYRPRRATL